MILEPTICSFLQEQNKGGFMLRRSEVVFGVVLLLLTVFTSGCSLRAGDFTVASTKNIGMLSQKGDRVEGEDCATRFLWFPIAGPVDPNFKTAMDKALEKAKGDVISEAVLWETKINMIIFGQHCFKVEGKVARGEFGKKM
jgi:hypothetical protein